MTTVITINGKPHSQSARHTVGMKKQKPRASISILIEISLQVLGHVDCRISRANQEASGPLANQFSNPSRVRTSTTALQYLSISTSVFRAFIKANAIAT